MNRLPWQQRYDPANDIPSSFKVATLTPNADQPAVVKQSLQVREKRIVLWPGDIVVGNSTDLILQQGTGLPDGCVGFRFINVTGNVLVAINGQGRRTVLNGDTYSGGDIQSLEVITDATGSAILQCDGEGS